MDCHRVRIDLSAHLQGELTDQERGQIEAHLTSCPACAEEAAAMKTLSDTIRRSLKEWVEQGMCPPDVVDRIEMSVRGRKATVWWKSWQTYAGAVAAAAAVFMILLGTRTELSEQLAALPLLSTVAERLVSPDIHVEVSPPSTPSDPPPPTRYSFDLSAAHELKGVTLMAHRLVIEGNVTRVQYSLRGGVLDRTDTERYAPVLTASGTNVPLRSFTATERHDRVEFYAYFDAVPAGQELSLTVMSSPVMQGGKSVWVEGPWKVSFRN